MGNEWGDYEDEGREHGGGSYVKWETKGQKVKGIYLKSEPSVQYPGSDMVTFATKAGNIVFGASKLLKDKLSQAATGDLVEVEFLGMKNAKRGGKPYKDFAVTSWARKQKKDEVPF